MVRKSTGNRAGAAWVTLGHEPSPGIPFSFPPGAAKLKGWSQQKRGDRAPGDDGEWAPGEAKGRGLAGGRSILRTESVRPHSARAALWECDTLAWRMLRVGLSGWSYPEWVGPFYPVALRSQPEAWLEFYAARFGTVEINSTFYAFPGEELVASWCRRGVALQERAPFEFSLKLPRSATHEALVAGDVAAAREIAGRFDREVLDALAGEGLLGAVLVQLSPRFRASEASVDALVEVLGALAERRVALEFRHPSWLQGECVAPLADRLFASPDVCLVEVDMPGVPRVLPPVSASHAYVRLHGRREELWRTPGGGAHDGARYDYLYSEEELRPWLDRLRALDAQRKDVRVYFNNTPHAKGVANAMDLLAMLGRAPDAPRPKLTEQTKLF